MATDAYMFFVDYNDTYLKAESQVNLGSEDKGALFTPFQTAQGQTGLFEVEDYSFDIEQTLNIGSQSTGAGAGRVTFNPFSITRKIDRASPFFYAMACAGQSFKKVGLGLRKSAGGTAAGRFFVNFRFSLVAVKTLAWAHDEESPKETITFEYGALLVYYGKQEANGDINEMNARGWNRVKNEQFTDAELTIT